VLLLDETTVGLDARAEQVVVQPLTRLMDGRTLITATHQPALTALATCSIHLHPCDILDEPPPRPYQVAGTAR
jgi:ABC-type transport system involved in cytochrome bd biosynthesis fused ATPase/permease subunit